MGLFTSTKAKRAKKAQRRAATQVRRQADEVRATATAAGERAAENLTQLRKQMVAEVTEKKKQAEKLTKDAQKAAAQTAKETQAAAAKAAKDAKAQAKAQLKDVKKSKAEQLKEARKLTKAEAKQVKKQQKRDLKTKKAELQVVKEKQWNAKRVNRYFGIAQLLAPLVLPVAYKAAGATRAKVEGARAKRLGVSQEALRSFTGHGAPLLARIAGARESLDSLPTGTDSGFKRDAAKRLDELQAAVTHSEHMTPQQRRQSHRAITTEINRIDGEILERLGVRTH